VRGMVVIDLVVGGMVVIDLVAGGMATTEVAGKMGEVPGEMAMVNLSDGKQCRPSNLPTNGG
ncbi:MAG: hypothetical protein AB8B70_04420, partial [Prochlorococcus sp.]